MKPFNIRKATQADLPFIVAMLADDVLGKSREKIDNGILPSCYLKAFDEIQHDRNAELTESIPFTSERMILVFLW